MVYGFKIKSIERIAEIATGKVVQCHGVFDLLHRGHLEYLEMAKGYGDCLVVTVTSDKYVNKGKNRPICPQEQRAAMLAGLQCVDYVAINDAPDASAAIKTLQPDLFVKGTEYLGTECEEFRVARLNGAEVIFTDTPKLSTTEIIAKCKLV